MDFVKNIKEDSILIIPNNIKNKVLDYINENKLLVNLKIMSFNDLKKELLFDYNEETIYELMKTKGYSYPIALDYIKNLYYLNKDTYEEKKLKELLDIKNLLDEKGLLIKNDLFKDLLKSKDTLYVYGFDYINKFNSYLLDIAKEYIKVDTSYNNKYENEYEHKVYSLKTLEDEILFVAEKISDLIASGIPLNKIFIAGIDNEYIFTIKRIFKEYGIPVFLQNETSLSDTVIAKEFFDNLTNDNCELLLNRLKLKYDVENNKNSLTIYNSLFNLVNKFYFVENILDVKEIMVEEAQRNKISSTHMKEEITTTSIYDNVFNDDEYVFLLNFNMGVFPKVKKDEDYINDELNIEIKDTTNEINRLNKECLLKTIKNIKNITITYKNESAIKGYFESPLIADNFEVEKIDFTYSKYSDTINKLLFAKRLDSLVKFNYKDPTLPILNNTYNIGYNTYSNDLDQLEAKQENIIYSYSNISDYYSCPFKFYCSNILKINEFENTPSTFIGNAFHEVFYQYFKNGESIDETYDNYVEKHKNDIEYTPSVEFFTNKLKEELKTVISIIEEQYTHMDETKKQKFEDKILTSTEDLNLNTKINATIKGFVDKYIIINNDAIIIDYKTGSSDKVDRNLFEYGLHIQLPLYMYLLETLNGYNVAGIYLQKVLNNAPKKEVNKSLLELQKNSLKLDGLTTSNISTIEKFDDTLEQSENIKAIRIENSGNIGSKKRILYDDQKEELKDIMKTKLEEVINNVYDSKFDISPVYLKGNEDACMYCSFKDVCFKKDKQYNDLALKMNEGEENE